MNATSKLRILTALDIEQSKDSLPLTHHITSRHRGLLKNTVILHINHALSDVYALNELLIDDLSAKVFLITTPYNNTTYKSKKYDYLFLHRVGNSYSAFINSRKIDLPTKNTGFIEVIHLAIVQALEFIKRKYKNKKIIVLQDGGYSAAQSKLFSNSDPFQNLPNFLGIVEQTQSGTRLFAQKEVVSSLSYPVLTISRSFIKMRVESHFIAQRITEEVNRTIYKMGYFLNFKKVILAGYGIIGRHVAGYLKNAMAEVSVLEQDSKVRKLAEKEGFKTLTKITTESIDKSFCFIGCTGQCTFGVTEFINFLESKNKYYFLASGSSKRNEFFGLIDFFENHKTSAKKYQKQYPTLKKIVKPSVFYNPNGVLEYVCKINGITKTLYLLAEGFPINLYANEIQSVPDRAIDPIQALLTECVIKLREYSLKIKPGLHHISNPKIIKALNINEEAMLSDWFYLNDISAYQRKPFVFFKPHPLESSLKLTT